MQDKPKEVDEYVSWLIGEYNRQLNLNTDPKNPTRNQRLELALRVDEIAKGFVVIETFEPFEVELLQYRFPHLIFSHLQNPIHQKYGHL